jgi:hypothetical protein
VLEGHVKARSDFSVAGVADFALLGGQQRAAVVGAVDRMAAGAADLASQVSRSADMHLAEIVGVAQQAAILGFAGSERRKPDDLLRVGADSVEKARAVTPLATGALRRLIPQNERHEMRVATEVARYVCMAALADLATDKLLAWVALTLSHGGEWQQCRSYRRQRVRKESLHSTWPAQPIDRAQRSL